MLVKNTNIGVNVLKIKIITILIGISPKSKLIEPTIYYC